MLDCRNLTVGYGREKNLLNKLDLTVPKGSITALLGANGVGKTTLFKAILQEIPYTGSVFCDNTCLRELAPRQRARLISILPQHLPAPTLSVRETVALGLSPHVARLGTAEWERVEDAVDAVGLSSLAERLVSTLSGGERQKTFLAMLLVQDTPVLLLDEPTAHMDSTFIARFYELLHKEARKGKAILLVTHDLGEAFAEADRIAVLEQGHIAFVGTATEALEQEIPEKYFSLTRYVAKRGEKTAVFFRAEH